MSSTCGNAPESAVTESEAPDALAALQQQFAAHIRDPQHQAAPDDVEDRRMAIYRELFYNNIKGFLSNNFPVLRRILGEPAWPQIVRDFFIEHRAHTPLFPELPREFLRYLQDVRETRSDDPPFMLELAHYEWVELALSIDDSEPDAAQLNPDGDLLEENPLLSPQAWLLQYQYPVHRIGPKYQPTEAPQTPTYLLVYRAADDKIKFMNLNPVSARLLSLLAESPYPGGRQVIEQVSRELQHPHPQRVLQAGTDLLNDLRDRGVIIGTRRM